jgi:glutamyl-tRNA synthetase
VVRGQEHINTSFPQLMLYQAIGWKPPEFAHIPLILGPNREKLPKRLHPEADVMLHRQNGILPEALLNFIVRLGWSHGNDEVISVEQMKAWFDFEHVGTTSGVWNSEKLAWLNQQWLKKLDPSLIASRLLPFLKERGVETQADSRLEKIVLALRERSKTLVDMAELALPFFSNGVTLDAKAAAKHLTAEAKPLLTSLRAKLDTVGSWQTHELDAQVKAVSEEASVGMGKVAQPIRVAVTGSTISPGIGETLELIGRDESLRRLDAALAQVAPNS